MRALLLGLFALTMMAGSAAADDYPGPPAVSIADTGPVAVAWTLSQGSDASVTLGSPGSLRTVRVRTGIVLPPSFSTVSNLPFITVAAQPGGGARLLWLGRSIDYQLPQPSNDSVLRTILIAADGTPSPVQDLAAHAYTLSAATNARGDMFATVSVDGHWMLAEAPAGGSFALTPAPIDGRLLVAALADHGAAAVASGASVVIRDADGTFGQPLTVPGLADATALDIASDGTTVVGDYAGAALRPPASGFNAAVHENGTMSVDPVSVAAFAGGEGLFTQSSGPTRVYDLPKGGGAPVPRDTGTSDRFGSQLAGREDGAAVFTRGNQLFARDSVGAFRGPADLGPSINAVGLALSATSQLVAVSTTSRKENTVAVNGKQVARYSRDSPPDPPYVPAAIARRVTARRHVARVPIRCVIITCRGVIRTAAGAKTSFDIAGQDGKLVRVRVPARGRRVNLTVTVKPPAASGGRIAVVHARRKLVRGARARVGCAPPWAERLATGGGANLWRLDTDRSLACAPQIPQRIITSGPLGIYGPAAINAHWAVLPEITPGHLGSSGTTEVVRHDLITGATSRMAVQSNGFDPTHVVAKIAITDKGAIVITDRVDGYPRIRLLTPTEDRILDAGPGIAPTSLNATANTATWTRDGLRQHADVP